MLNRPRRTRRSRTSRRCWKRRERDRPGYWLRARRMQAWRKADGIVLHRHVPTAKAEHERFPNPCYRKEPDMKSPLIRTICRFLIASMLLMSFGVSQAGMIGADQVAAGNLDRAIVMSTLDRSDVSYALRANGVDPRAAKDRVAAMPDDLVPEVYLPSRFGSLQVEMAATPRRHGIVSYKLKPRYEDLLREVAAGNPVIVLLDYGVWPVRVWHYSVVVGFDRPGGQVTLRSGVKRSLLMPIPVLEYLWKESDYWALVTLSPRSIPATAEETAYLDAVRAMARVASLQEAERAYAGFLVRWPDNEVASIGLAGSLHAQGRLPDAEAALRRALERHPASVPLLNNLAQTLSDEGRNDEALALLDRALVSPGAFVDEVKQTRALVLGRNPR